MYLSPSSPKGHVTRIQRLDRERPSLVCPERETEGSAEGADIKGQKTRAFLALGLSTWEKGGAIYWGGENKVGQGRQRTGRVEGGSRTSQLGFGSWGRHRLGTKTRSGPVPASLSSSPGPGTPHSCSSEQSSAPRRRLVNAGSGLRPGGVEPGRAPWGERVAGHAMCGLRPGAHLRH